mgnify:CR=1 FL=1
MTPPKAHLVWLLTPFVLAACVPAAFGPSVAVMPFRIIAAVDSTMLGPGGETTFTVTVPAASQIGRYRVSFRTEDRVIPHIDRRDRSGN